MMAILTSHITDTLTQLDFQPDKSSLWLGLTFKKDHNWIGH